MIKIEIHEAVREGDNLKEELYFQEIDKAAYERCRSIWSDARSAKLIGFCVEFDVIEFAGILNAASNTESSWGDAFAARFTTQADAVERFHEYLVREHAAYAAIILARPEAAALAEVVGQGEARGKEDRMIKITILDHPQEIDEAAYERCRSIWSDARSAKFAGCYGEFDVVDFGHILNAASDADSPLGGGVAARLTTQADAVERFHKYLVRKHAAYAAIILARSEAAALAEVVGQGGARGKRGGRL